MEPTTPQFRRPALTGEDNPFDRKGRSYDYASPKSYEDTRQDGPGRDLKVEANRSAEGDAHSSLLESHMNEVDALPQPHNQDDRWQNDKEREALKGRLKHAEDSNNEEVRSANLIAKGATIGDMVRAAKMGKPYDISGDAVARARQGKKPQLRKEI